MSHYRLTAAAIMALMIGGGLYFYEPVKVERPKPIEETDAVHGFGIIDLEQIQKNNPAGDELKELNAREIRLKLELNEVMRPVMPPKLPEIDITPFEESAREKNMQNLISQLSEIRAKKQRAAEEYKKQTEPDYIKKRDAIRDEYLNESFNIAMKLRNADILRLSPEQIQELEKRLDDLVIKRNEVQRVLLEEWTAEINDYANAQFADEESRIKREAEETYNKYNDEAMAKIRELQDRNRALMEAATNEIAFRQRRRREILNELEETSNARAELEDKILNSIVDEAGKLGALNKLEMIFVKRESSYFEEKLFYGNMDIKFEQKRNAKIIAGKGAKDLTKDLLKALRR